jgi:hypothetical protein
MDISPPEIRPTAFLAGALALVEPNGADQTRKSDRGDKKPMPMSVVWP